MSTVVKRFLTSLFCLGFCLTLAACTPSPDTTPPAENPAPSASDPVITPSPEVTPEPSEPAAEPSPSETFSPEPTPEPSPSESVSPEPTVEPSPEPSVEPSPEPTISAEPSPSPSVLPGSPLADYQFGTALEETAKVEDSVFDTVVFLGDSRTEGLQLFGGLRRGTYYWARGMTVFRVDDPKYAIFEVDGEKLTMIGALGKKEYSAVYIMVGVNELGYPASSYEKNLAIFVDQVLAAQPGAVVYLQTLPPVNEEVAAKSGLASYINNTNIAKFNAAIVRIAAEKQVVLLDTAEAYRDETGILPAELASDGCHFAYGAYSRWADYLRCHVMDPAVYHALRTAEPAPEPTPETSAEPAPEPTPEPSPEPTDEVPEV